MRNSIISIGIAIMKISAIPLIVLLTFLNSFASETLGQSPLSKKVTLSVKEAALKKVLKEVETKTGVRLYYSPELIMTDRRITVEAKDERLETLFARMLTPLNIRVDVDERARVFLTRITDAAASKEKSDAGTMVARTLTGKVLAADGAPVEGATVQEKESGIGTATSADGSFELNIPGDKGVLVVSAVGYETKEVPLTSAATITVVLTPVANSLNDVVVVGFGTQKKVNLTGAVSSVSAKDIENRPITQASQALAGLASGVTIAQGSGRPGNDGAGITIRGLGTFSGAGNSPLILVDGLASSINDVDPNNIKSISVLKDAASASIYGTRAANGVILIETKRGQRGKLQLSYNSYVGWQKVTELPDFVPSWEFATLTNEANVNAGQSPTYSTSDIEKFRDGSDPDNFPNVPHLKNLLNSGSGFQTNHNLSFTGGDAKNTYLFSVGYLSQDGLVRKNTYNKYNILLNFDSKLKDNLTLRVNLSGNAANTDEPRQYDGEMTSMIGFAVRQGPIFAGKKSDGTYGYQDNYSPEAWLDSKSFVNRKNKFFLGGAELAWEAFKGFTLTGKAGYNYTNYADNSFASTFVFDQFKTVGPSNLSVQSGDNSLLTLQALANYTKTFGDHTISALAGFSQEEFREDWTRAFRDNFPNNELYEINAGAASNMQAFGSGSEWALRSYFGRINYNFNGKYLLEANARYDGTSRFPSEGRWGVFPSFSAGWRISEENFLRDNVSWINNLKLRASWGKLGNQNVGNYPYQNLLSLGQNYTFGGALASGARVTTLANGNITWEKTQVTDIGLDADFFNGKLGLVFDYFNKTTSDILYNITVSSVLGLGTSEVNAGEVKNTGFELLLNYRDRIGDFNFGISPNFSYVKNNITKLGGGLEEDISKGLFVGSPMNAIYGYVADGLFVDAADIARSPSQPYAAEPGFVKYKDISGPDGVPDGKVDATYDRTIIGSTFPKYSFGATLTADYKGFDLMVLLHGLGGFEKQMGSYQAFAFYNSGQVQRWQADNRWTTDNPDPNAQYIKMSKLNMGSGTILTSTFWNRNASFLRVKNIQLGYTLPASVVGKAGIERCRIFFSGQNLFSINNFYQGWDPEMSQSTGDNSPFYPITSVYTFGVNVKF